VIEMSGNTGFARAVNFGWKAAATEWVAILNSDVELDSRWLERLMAGIGDAGYATGTLFDATNRTTIDGTYDLVSRAACAWRAGHGEPAGHGDLAGHGDPAPEKSSPIAIAPGTACIFRRDLLYRLTGFDERYGSYLEDVDLGLRCLRQGFTGVYVPDAVAYHLGSATLGRWHPQVVRLISRNQLLLIARHYDRALFRSCFWPIVAGQLLWGLMALRHGRGLAWLAGKAEGLRDFRLESQSSPQSSAKLREFLMASENEIRRRATGPYWRWYFRLIAAH
jgi:GT2 family glycosyltransferase